MTGAYDMIGSITRLDDEDDKDKNPADGRNAPDVIEKALFEARVVMLTGEVNDIQARRVTERLFALASQNANPITFVISSPGGHVESGDMIHDVIKFINAPVRMLGTGWVASAGALIYAPPSARTAIACRTPASCCTNRAAASAAWRRTLKFKRAKSCACASV
jgi:ATP-dependent protease ClpP protease subunit